MPPPQGTSPDSPDDRAEAGSPLRDSRNAPSAYQPSSARDTTEPAAAGPSSSSPGSVRPGRVPSLRASSSPQSATFGSMDPSSSLSSALSNARVPSSVPSAGNLPPDLMQKAIALQLARKRPPHPQAGGPSGSRGDMGRGVSPGPGGMQSNMRLPPHMNVNMGGGVGRPGPPGFPQPTPSMSSVRANRIGGPSLSERRNMKIGSLPGSPGMSSPRGPPRLSDLGGGGASGSGSPNLNGGLHDSRMNDFKHYIDAEKGWITFEGAATITRTGVNFAGGHTFRISLDEIQVLDELGKGNYGTVYKVRHAKPAVPRFGPGLSGFKATHVPPPHSASSALPSASSQSSSLSSTTLLSGDAAAKEKSGFGGSSSATDGTTGKVMAMKEIRLELDEAKFTTILKELVILHECVSPYIIEFYGAFFQEGAVYMCIEYMDGGSIDKLYAGGIPEPVLRKITYSTVMGLKTLKEKHNIIHRDVKPTNILVNTRGQVKICDFGVSGNLVASIAKTNIGCQSYMAPERISGSGTAQTGGANAEGTYSVQSDIWSLGLTIIECAMGRYPYPPEVSSTIFSQLSAIVNGEPPDMPDNYSATAHDFVRSCLNKNPLKRHTYTMLLSHPWLKPLGPTDAIEETEESEVSDSDSEEDEVPASSKENPSATAVAGDAEVAAWVSEVIEKKKSGSLTTRDDAAKPALHTAPLAP